MSHPNFSQDSLIAEPLSHSLWSFHQAVLETLQWKLYKPNTICNFISGKFCPRSFDLENISFLRVFPLQRCHPCWQVLAWGEQHSKWMFKRLFQELSDLGKFLHSLVNNLSINHMGGNIGSPPANTWGLAGASNCLIRQLSLLTSF